MSLTDAIISAVLRKGVLLDSKNVETAIDIPYGDSLITIRIKADNVQLKLDKGE